ncbi:uracil phosphoribosyltransferase [Candidatus Dependentiae bacterium]
MKIIKELYLTKLRDKNTTHSGFRQNTHTIAHIIAQETLSHVPTEKIVVETPIAKAPGLKLKYPVTLVPILRAGMSMLEPFLHYYKDARVGVVGLKRDEKTAIAHLYYENIPPIAEHETVIILDPMISTGGTGLSTLEILHKRGVKQKNIIFAAIICSTEGLNAIKNEYPDITILQAGIDEELNKNKFIVPGLGDFGDRYYGSE